MTMEAVTQSLQEIVRAAIDMTAKNAAVRIGPPRAVEPGETEVSLCCYRLQANAARRSQPIPPRTRGGFIPAGVRTAYDLHYLIAFAADGLDAETMLGNVLAALDSRPVLTGGKIQPEPIRLVPEYLSLEDLARLWGAYRLPLRPSLTYVASPVLLDH